MTDEPQTPPSGMPAPASTNAHGPADAGGRRPTDALVAKANERPELAVGAAFAGGFVLATILKRLAG